MKWFAITLSFLVVLFSGACSPSVVRIDLNQEKDPTSTTSLPETTETDPTPTEGFQDCGSDLDCFYDSLDSCQESRLQYSQSLDLMGALSSTSLSIVLLGSSVDGCEFSLKTDQVSITYSEEAVQQLRDAGMSDEEIEAQRLTMEDSQLTAGFDEVCTGSPEDLAEMLKRWEAGHYSMDDWAPFSCQGKIFSAFEAESEPTQAPTETAEVLIPEDGNLLANNSFESDPEATFPRWIVDTKNTDVVARWTTDQSKLGQHALMLSASQSANQGFPGWFTADLIQIEEPVWHVFEVWAMSPDGADAFISAQFLNDNGEMVSGQSSGCVDLAPEIWTRVSFGILETSLEGIRAVHLGLQQCLRDTDGALTHLYYDQVYFSTTPP
jgi:hypothetical protein